MVGNAVEFVLLAVLLQSAPSHQAIRCLECNSHNNSMCIDPTEYDRETILKYIPIVQCGHGVIHKDGNFGQGEFFCRKVVQTILHKGYQPDLRVMRGCGWVRHHKECYKADNEDHLETVCQCFNDECNAAGVHTVSAVLVMMAAVKMWL